MFKKKKKKGTDSGINYLGPPELGPGGKVFLTLARDEKESKREKKKEEKPFFFAG